MRERVLFAISIKAFLQVSFIQQYHAQTIEPLLLHVHAGSKRSQQFSAVLHPQHEHSHFELCDAGPTGRAAAHSIDLRCEEKVLRGLVANRLTEGKQGTSLNEALHKVLNHYIKFAGGNRTLPLLWSELVAVAWAFNVRSQACISLAFFPESMPTKQTYQSLLCHQAGGHKLDESCRFSVASICFDNSMCPSLYLGHHRMQQESYPQMAVMLLSKTFWKPLDMMTVLLCLM
jgi:hypothetical protein